VILPGKPIGTYQVGRGRAAGLLGLEQHEQVFNESESSIRDHCKCNTSSMDTFITLITGLIIGSVSGIGGAVIGSWMTGKAQLATLRMQLNADENRSRKNDRRQLYVSFATKANDLIGQIIIYPDRNDRDNAKRDLLEAQANLIHISNEIMLFGPVKVNRATDNLCVYLTDCSKHLRISGTSEFSGEKVDEHLGKVAAAMREDIEEGYPIT
jgi:hypothetical protein